MAERPKVHEFEKEHVRGYGTVHGNGDTSYGHDIITVVAGTSYPPEGVWAKNVESHESAVIIKGKGGVAIRGALYTELDAAAPVEAQKRAAEIPAGEHFRWSAAPEDDMVISLLTTPAFKEAQYFYVEESLLAEIEAIHDDPHHEKGTA